MADATGRQPDPDDADQERFASGSVWTDQERPIVSGPSHGEPDHIPQLHRAISAAVSDLDAMDDRISTLFDRSDDAPTQTGVARATARTGTGTEAATAAGASRTTDDDDIIDIFGDTDMAWTEMEDDAPVERHGAVAADRMAIISQYEEDLGGAFSDLDAELAAETPTYDGPAKEGRRRFGWRAKGTTSSTR